MAEKEVVLKFRVTDDGLSVLDKASSKLTHVEYAAKTASEMVQRLQDRLKHAEGSFSGSVAGIRGLGSTTFASDQTIGLQAARSIGAGLQNLNISQQLTQTTAAATAAETAIVGAATGISTAWSGVGLAVTGAVTVAGYALKRFATDAVAAAAEQEKAIAALNAQLQIQGRYSDDFSRALQDQAAALQKTTTFADETVNSAQAMLATFPKLGNDVIPRATQAALDLASALGTDLQGAAQTIGVALNDPAEGLLRLSRLGVRFTDDQKALIQSLIDTGNAAQAQTYILDELASRMGGRAQAAAGTYSGSIAQLSNSFGDLLEEFGNFIIQNETVRQGIANLKGNVDAATASVKQYREENDLQIQQDTAGWYQLVADAIVGYKNQLLPLNADLSSHIGLLGSLAKALAGIGAQYAALKDQGGFDLAGNIAETNARVAQANKTGQYGDALRAYRDSFLGLIGARTRRSADTLAGPPDLSEPGGFTPAGEFGLFGGTDTGPRAPQGPTRGGPSNSTYDYFQVAVGPFAPGDPNYQAPKPGAAARTGSTDRSAVRQQADLEKRTAETITQQEEVRLALLDAQVSMRERALQFAQQDLELAKQSGASQQDQLRLASQMDDLERQRLIATRDRIQAELDGLQQFGPVVSAEVIQLNDQLAATNEELARGPQYAEALRQKLADSRSEANGLGDSFARAIDSLQSSGGKIDAANVLRNVLQIDGSKLLGQLIGGAADKFGIQGNSLTEIIGNGAKDAFQSITGLFSSSPAAAPSSFVGPPTAAEAAAGAGSQQAIQAGAAAGSAAAGGYAAIILAGIGALQGGFKGISEETKRLGSNQQSILTAGAAGAVGGSFSALGFGGIGDILSKAITKVGNGGFAGSALVNTTLVSPLLTGGVPDPIIGLLTEQIFSALGLFQPKTKGSLFKKSLAELYGEAGLPTQREFSGGGRKGVRVPSFEQSANQETFDYLQSIGLGRTGLIENVPLRTAINENVGTYRPLREETTGVSLALAPGTRGAGVFFNAIQNNFSLLGVSVDEARRQLLKLAGTAGVDLVGGLENLNKKFLQGKITQDALQAGAQGLVELFTADLPRAIDVAKIIADRTDSKGGIDIAASQAGIRGALAAYDIRQQIDDQRLQRTDPRLQGTEIKRRISEVDRQLGDDTLTLAQREDLLRRRSDLGFQYASYADQRFGGSQRTRETEYGYAIAEDTAKKLEQLGIDLKEPTEANTDATKDNSRQTQENTASIKGLTAAILKGIKTDGTLNVTGLNGESDAQLETDIRRILKQLLRDPEIRGEVRREAVNQ